MNFATPRPFVSRPADSVSSVLRPRSVALLVLSALVLGGCAFKRVAPPAPVEDRSVATAPSSRPIQAADVAVEPQKVLPLGAENAGKPGYFTVRPGDTLIRIALEVGQNWRDLVRWNSLENPNRIEVGQVLRIVPPVAGSAPAVTTATVAPGAGVSPGVTTAAVNEPAVTAKPLPSSTPLAAATPAPARPAPAPAPGGEDDVAFIWPAAGTVVASFDEQKNKGVGIAGKVGDPVVAAADGRVVYAGSGLRGYGNLIILKHNNTYLTAYAHNQSLLVKEDQDVKQGQKIAEMGSSDADRVKLHFEVRRQGKPVDPARFLPSR